MEFRLGPDWARVASGGLSSDVLAVHPLLNATGEFADNPSMNAFDRYVGIDYSGAQTPSSSLEGLQVYMADYVSRSFEVSPPPSPRKHWTRQGAAEWLLRVVSESRKTLVGIDHGFSFPLAYFCKHGLSPAWRSFLEDFQNHWPADERDTWVDFVRDGECGKASHRSGDRRWRRLTEVRARGAKSVFYFDVQGSVAKATHSGLPWLRYLEQHSGGRVHFWPFDGWEPPPGTSVVAEVYPALWSRRYPKADRDGHQHDAYSIAEWMRRADSDGSPPGFMIPTLTEEERKAAATEGLILGVM